MSLLEERPDTRSDSFFDPWALLTVPPQVRPHFAALGEHFYELAFEHWGIEGIDGQVAAIAASMDVAAHRLRAIGEEPDVTDLNREEQRMCVEAGRLAERLAELAQSLKVVATPHT